MQFAIYFTDLLIFNVNESDIGGYCILSGKNRTGSEPENRTANKFFNTPKSPVEGFFSELTKELIRNRTIIQS